MSRKNADEKHYSREWLNAPGHHGNGFIVTKVESGGESNKTTWATADVTIADCSRSIHLDFYVDNTYNNDRWEAERDNDLAKLDLLISELTHLRRIFKREVKKIKPKATDDE